MQPGDVVGIGIHTGNALRGYEVGRLVRERGATVIFGGIHATLYPEEPPELGGAHAVVKGDGDVAWGAGARRLSRPARLQPVYEGGRVDAEPFKPARWDLLPDGSYMWASVQTIRGCPKHCSFCSVWRTDGQQPRQRHVDVVVDEIVELRRKGYPLHRPRRRQLLSGLAGRPARWPRRRADPTRLHELEAIRAERFELMERLAELPRDMVFFTQITMEAAEDTAFLDAMRNANIKGALVGVEAVTPEGLKDVYKGFNVAGEALVERLQTFRTHGVHVLGSFIFGLPSDRPSTFEATAALAQRAGVTFAQFVMLTPFPGTLDFDKWEETLGREPEKFGGIPLTPPLADPAGDAAQGLHAAPGDGRRRDPRADPGRVGQVLQPELDLAALDLRQVATSRGWRSC